MKTEAEIFGQYLLGKTPDQKTIELYNSAISKINFGTISSRDEKVLRFVLERNSFLGLVDSSNALFNSKSLLRKKLHVMFAILESRAEYSNLFLPEKRAHNSFIYMIWVGKRAVFKALIGRFILIFI